MDLAWFCMKVYGVDGGDPLFAVSENLGQLVGLNHLLVDSR